jgi:hypothetical protein
LHNRKRTNTDDSIPLSSHITRIWQALSPAEQERTQAIITQLTHAERMQWLLELSALSVPDAVARVRSVIRPHTSASGGHGVPS